VRCVLCLFTVISFLAATGCVSDRTPSATARLLVESTAGQGLSPSARLVSPTAETQTALARIVAHANGQAFRAEVAKAAGVSPETVGTLVVQGVAGARIVQVRAELPDREVAAKLVNAAASRLAEDFRNDPTVKVKVVGSAVVPAPAKEPTEK